MHLGCVKIPFQMHANVTLHCQIELIVGHRSPSLLIVIKKRFVSNEKKFQSNAGLVSINTAIYIFAWKLIIDDFGL